MWLEQRAGPLETWLAPNLPAGASRGAGHPVLASILLREAHPGCHPTHNPFVPQPAERNPASLACHEHFAWVSKWVDYSNKYGFGYQLSNHRIGVLFNDGTHMALSADRK